MFSNLLKNRKGQNTAEYALLIALVVAGIIAMQTYAQRALQARVRDASVFMTTTGPEADKLGKSVQYEPYYQQSNYEVTRDASESKTMGEGLVAQQAASERTRLGEQKSSYVENGATGANTSPGSLDKTNPLPAGL